MVSSENLDAWVHVTICVPSENLTEPCNKSWTFSPFMQQEASTHVTVLSKVLARVLWPVFFQLERRLIGSGSRCPNSLLQMHNRRILLYTNTQPP